MAARGLMWALPVSPRTPCGGKAWRSPHVSCFKQGDREEGELQPDPEHVPFTESRSAQQQQHQKHDKDDNADLSSSKSNGWFSDAKKAVHRFFRLHSEAWTVPWTAETITQVTLLWIVTFWFVGSWIIPFLAHSAGFRKEALSHRGQALYSLLTDIAEGMAGITILHRCLARFRPLPSGWFHFSWKGNWQLDVGVGCLLFPLVNRLSQINIDLVPMIPAPPVGVSSVEQSIVARDPVAMAIYAMVVVVCAPVWEEIIFRGFLLPSLTKYMPLWPAILVSAVAFALAHFNAQRVLPLVFLGVVMGAVFARSKNLLASMLLHSLWNGFVFLDLMK